MPLPNKLKKEIALAILFLAMVISCIHPLYPDEMYLQHSVTVTVIILLFLVARSGRMSNTSYFLIIINMLLHVLGARWIYSLVPYDQWIHSLTGWDFNKYFGFQRNEYDRLVHFMYGVLFMIPLAEFFRKQFRASPSLSWLVAWTALMSGSMIYEIFEWGLTLILSPDAADSYNGQQGDLWDSQKDMAMALLGATLVILVLSVFPRFRKKLEKL